jgi:1-acyl-sn-glycerol-3-phosphate acyltransferase
LVANIRLVLILVLVALITALFTPFQLAGMRIRPAWSRKLPVLWHRSILWLIGVRVHKHGRFSRKRPLMLVANHVSWVDILVLGSLGELCFIAKHEVRSWPGVNWLSRMQRTVFVNREARREAGVQAESIAARLLEGDVMVLFAEGTTGNGNHLLGFKSALMAAPQFALKQSHLEEVHVQPVALAYNTLHGMPLGRYHQAYAAWPGDLELIPHLVNFVRQGAFDVDVGFGEAFPLTEESKRKQLMNQCYDEVRRIFTRLRRLHHREG